MRKALWGGGFCTGITISTIALVLQGAAPGINGAIAIVFAFAAVGLTMSGAKTN